MNFLEKLKKSIWEIENQKFPVEEMIGVNSTFQRFRFQFGCNIEDQLKTNGWKKYDETTNLHYFKHESCDFEIVCDKE